MLPQAEDHATSDKAVSAQIFKDVYDRARTNAVYLHLKDEHKKLLKANGHK